MHNVGPMCNGCDMHNSDLLTAKQKADELGISRSTLTRYVRAGKVTPAWRDETTHNGVMLFERETRKEAVAS